MPEPEQGAAKWWRVGAVVALLLFAFFVARSCQQSQVRVSKEQAIATAKREVDYAPDKTQIRLLRQGINRKPFWFVSLAVTSSKDPDVFTRLAVVEVDANTGKVTSVKEDLRRDKEAAARESGQDGQAVEPANP